MTLRFSKKFWSGSQPAAGKVPPPAGSFESSAGWDRSLYHMPPTHPPVADGIRQDDTPTEPREGIYVPEHYESNYAYPLIVWLTESRLGEAETDEIFPQISARNYFGLRVPLKPRATSNAQSENDVELEQRLQSAVCDVRQQYHIHSERIFLAGFAAGATAALEIGLRRPEWFGGLIALAGRFPTTGLPLVRFRDLKGLRVLLCGDPGNPNGSVAELIHTSRLLHTAGTNVSTQFFETACEPTPQMLIHVNEWVMDRVCAGNCV